MKIIYYQVLNDKYVYNETFLRIAGRKMADIEKVFNFKNKFQVSNLFNKLNLNSEQLSNFTQIIAEGWDIEETRNNLLEYVSMEDYETYMYIKELLREAEENNGTLGLNQVIELKGLIEDVARKMSDNLHMQLADLITKDASSNISNLFFTYVKDFETNKDINIDLDQNVDGINFASAIYNMKNDIKTILDNTKSEKKEQPNVTESFKIPAKYTEINKAFGKKLEELKESYKDKYLQSNDEYYQEMLYEANIKSSTSKLSVNKIIENINKGKRTTIWVNECGRMIFLPKSRNKWDIIHYGNAYTNATTKQLVEFVNKLNFKLLNEAEEPKKEEKLYDDSIDKFVMDIQDTVDKDQEHRGIKNIEESNRDDAVKNHKLEKDHEVEDWNFFYKGEKIGSTAIDRDKKTGQGKTIWKDWEDGEPRLIPTSKEYQKGSDEYWRTYLQHKKKTEGLTPSEEEELAELEKNINECTCAGNIAGVSPNIFAKPIKRKTNEDKKESKDLKFAKEATDLLDEYCFTLNGKHISYDARNGFNVFIEGVVSTVSNKDEYFTLLEMIDNNEDISDYLMEGLSIEDFKFLKEDIDAEPMPEDDGMSSPNQEEERKPDTQDPEYKNKKEQLKQMADMGTSNISVKQKDNMGNETTSDNFEIVGIEDTDDNGKASNAIVKDKTSGEMKTIDPHIIDIKQ